MDNYRYDMEADAFSLTRKDYYYTESIELTGELIIDLNKEKEIIGIEVLNASKIFQVKPEQLINPKSISVKIEHDEEETYINITIKLKNLIKTISEPLLHINFNQYDTKNAIMQA